MSNIEPDNRDDLFRATPEVHQRERRPGELAFGAFLLLASLGLLWSAYGISGFRALSAPGTVPMATTLIMVLSAAIMVVETIRQPLDRAERLSVDILPAKILIVAVLLLAYALLLRPLGFLPTSALFLVVSIRILSNRGWLWTLLVSVGSLLVIWLIFRIVFTVLMPPGIMPEAQIIQFFRNLF